MKNIAITAITFLIITACNNHHHHIRTERMDDNNTSMKIEDDNEKLSIKIQTRNAENPIDYNESFDVIGMSGKQKKELEKYILDSLQVKKIK